MRIFLFQRIPFKGAVAVAVALAAIQLFLGTGLNYVLLHFAYVILWVMALNIAGGFTRASGTYIFWFGLMTVLTGSTIKICIGEAPDTNSKAPVLTMAIYTTTMAVFVVAAYLVRRITGDTESLAERITLRRPFNYRDAALGALLVSTVLTAMGFLFSSDNGSVYGAIARLNILPLLSIILGTIDAVYESGGRRATNWIVCTGGALMFISSLDSYSKQGMFAPLACWVVGLAFAGFRFRWIHIFTCALIAAFMFYFMVPISQIGRNYGRTLPTSAERIAFSIHMMENIQYYRAIQDSEDTSLHETTSMYFGKNVGPLLERITTWQLDDQLVDYSERGNMIGYAYVGYLFYNWIPHILVPNKEALMPTNAGGNYYARQLGAITPDDETTGVSFGLPAEVYHLDGWNSVLLIELPVFILHFLVIEVIAGDLRRTPWGVFYAMVFSHVAAESGLTNLVYFIWYTNISIVFCIFMATYIAPLAGQLVGGSSTKTPPSSPPLNLGEAVAS